MQTPDHPQSFGVFKPVGHVVVSFPPSADMPGAVEALTQAGFAQGDITEYTAEMMQAQADSDIEQAGVLASIGQELNLVKAHRELAVKGHSFLMVLAPEDEQASRVAEIAKRFHASRAQKYGRLMIEELVDVGTGEVQVAESPDRGLDAQTPSGHEAISKPPSS